MSQQFNPDHLDQLDQLQEARKQWQESEWRLSFLRTETGTPLQEANDDEIWEWYEKHQQHQEHQEHQLHHQLIGNQNNPRQIQFHP